MKRYMLFCGDEYYPGKGMRDFLESFDEIESAQIKGNELVDNYKKDWYQIYDLDLQKIIEHG